MILLQGPDGNRIPILAQGVKEIVISLLNQPTDSSLKAIVQVLKVSKPLYVWTGTVCLNRNRKEWDKIYNNIVCRQLELYLYFLPML